MTESVGVTYRVFFDSAHDAEDAESRIQRAGFDVERAGEPGATRALDARITTDSEAEADSKLAKALSGVRHDPLIEWQASRFSGFVPPRT
jgi:hypothetical protein